MSQHRKAAPRDLAPLTGSCSVNTASSAENFSGDATPARTRLSRRGLLTATAVALGSTAAVAATATRMPPAFAAAVQGKAAPTGGLGLTGTVVGRHRDVFRSFTLTSTSGVGVIVVGKARYTVTFNAGDGLDTVQIFNADTGALYYKASTPGQPAGDFVHDGKGNLYFSCGTALMVVSAPGKSIRRFGSVPQGISNLYDFQVDYKGRLWAGTYPTGVVVCLDPTTGAELARSPKLGKGNDYARGLSISPDRKTLWVGTGTADPDLFSLNVDAPAKPTRVTIPDRGTKSFVMTTAARGRKVFVWHDNRAGKGVVSVYDVVSKTWGPSPVSISGASISAVDAKGYAYVNAVGSIRRFKPGDADLVVERVAQVAERATIHISLVASTLYLLDRAPSALTATRSYTSGLARPRVSYRVVPVPLPTQSMVVDPATNTAYAGGYRGDGLCSTNLATGAFAHSAPTAGIQQIEGMTVDQGNLYVGSYVSAVLVKHRIAAGVKDGASYKQLGSLSASHRQSRPYAWGSTASHVVFGTVPEYGYRGGALGTIERSTGKVTVYNKLIPELSIVGLVGSGHTVYGTTSCRPGYGIADYTGNAVVFAADARSGKVLWKKALPGTDQLYGPVLIGTQLYVATLDTVVELRISDGAPLRTFVLGSRKSRPAWQSVALARIPGTTRLAHLAWGSLQVLETTTGQVAQVLTKANKHIGFDAQNAMWVTVDNDIVKLRLDTIGTSGAIAAKHTALGGVAKLGYPAAAEQALGAYSGAMQKFFCNGTATSIYWSPTHGARSVRTNGAIGARYTRAGAHNSGYGLPITDEVTVAGGAYQVFVKGNNTVRMLWTSRYGVFVVKEYKAIGKAWVAAGREKGWGWPTGDEYTSGKELRQNFSTGVTAHYLAGKPVWTTR